MPEVSVIIPTHDRRTLVCEAVASVLAQRDCAPEVIVVDDGSSDDTATALQHFGDRIRVLRQPMRGVSAARNSGARKARGAWLAFLDSDDLWEPTKLARQLAFHRARPGLLASQTAEVWVRNGVRVNQCLHHAKPDGDIFAPSVARCVVGASTVMLQRALFVSLGGFDESLPVCEDYDLWLRLGHRVAVGLLDEPLVIKRGGHADQLSRRHWGMDRFRVASLARLLSSGELRAAHRALAIDGLHRMCTILEQGARRRARPDEAARYRALASVWA
ncbi:MAG: glycosyltransferase family 2 protein [Candidatus Binatia bacterium]